MIQGPQHEPARAVSQTRASRVASPPRGERDELGSPRVSVTSREPARLKARCGMMSAWTASASGPARLGVEDPGVGLRSRKTEIGVADRDGHVPAVVREDHVIHGSWLAADGAVSRPVTPDWRP